jgi:hypothetical protein
MAGSFTDYAEAKILDAVLGGISLPQFTPYIGYFLTSPGESGPGSEPAGGGYNRVATASDIWLTSTVAQTQNVQDIICPRATANQGTVVAIGLFDSAVGGNCYVYYNSTDTELIENRDSLVILSGGLSHSFLAGGFSEYLKNLIFNHIYRGVPMPLFPTVYSGLNTAAPTDQTPGTEPTIGGYIRQPIANNATNFPATSGGIKQNAVEIEFPIATADIGNISHFSIYNAASGGQHLAYGMLNPAKTLLTNDQLKFLAGDIKVSLD